MKCSLGISNFLEEISSLSYSVVFLYFFALIAEEGFLISPCCSLVLCIQMLVSFHFSFAFRIGDCDFRTDKESLLYESAGAALTKYLKNGCLQQQKFISYCVGGWAAQFKVLADLVSDENSLLFPSCPYP